MKKTLFFNAIPSLLLLLIFASCGGGKVKVSGQFLGLQSEKVTLEQVSQSGNIVVDSTFTDDSGRYRIKAALPTPEATIYNLKVKNEAIPLFLAAGDRVTVNSLYGNARNYQVDGSRESQLIRDVNEIITGGVERLDSIAVAHSLYQPDSENRREAMTEYVREYQNIKRKQIGFIVGNSGSLAAIYALYQRLPGDDVLFNGETDIIYYRMVADSVSKHYPKSPYLASLQNAISQFEAQEKLIQAINDGLENPLPFPDLTITDIYNVKRTLSENLGKVILLDFWSSSAPEAAIVNAEYKELYENYSWRGFEIYQVNAGTSKTEWVNTVLDQKLPWISVSDQRGMAGSAFNVYNVRTLPANFLLDIDGTIVAKNIYGDDLAKAVSQLTRARR